MKRTIEFLASVEIEVTSPDDMAKAINAAWCKLGRVHEVSPDWSIAALTVCQLTTEQSRAVRVVTATAKNGGSVPQTMDEVAEGVKPILGHSTRKMDIGAKLYQAGQVAPYFVAGSRGGEV